MITAARATPTPPKITSAGRQAMTNSISDSVAGTVIFPKSPEKLYAPSALSDCGPAKARATSAEAIGCWALAPTPLIRSAQSRIAKPVLNPAKQ